MKNIKLYSLIIIISSFVFITIPIHLSAETIQDRENNCYKCHQDMEFLPEDFSVNDIHFMAGIGCESCHGGDASTDDEELAMSSNRGFKGVPDHNKIPQLCGKCHSDIDYMRKHRPRISTDQVSQYFESVHGQKLLKGNSDVAECASCHSAHNVFAVSDPRSTVYSLNVPQTCNKCHGDKTLMDKYNLKSNQFAEYSTSVHGVALLERRDVGAPACNDCHGNHGATPPGIESIGHVCGMCHVHNEEYFSKSALAKVFKEAGFHGCEQCHGYHAIQKPNDEMIGVGKESICMNCHTEGDSGFMTAQDMGGKLVVLRTKYEKAGSELREVVKKGMNDVEINFILQDTKQSLIQLRTVIHTFDTTLVNQKANEGIMLADNALELAKQEIDEYYNRRIGFGLATLAFIVLAFGVFLKIRQKK